MRALRCREFAHPTQLTIETLPPLRAVPGHVVVEVKAASLNFPDTLVVQGLYQVKPELPFTPGSDFAGVVSEVGEGVEHLAVGDEVFGFVMTGAFAEQVLAPAQTCFKKPKAMDFKVAASFMLAYGTSFHALKDRAQLKSLETLLVLGAAGGVGLAAVELGAQMGARVIAAAASDDKLALCKERGAADVINYSREDLKGRLKDLTQGKGVDVIYDPVGGDLAEPAFRSMAWGGRYLVVGFAAGDIPALPMNLPLLKGASLVGVFWGTFASKAPKLNMQNAQTLLQWLAEGKLKPNIYKSYGLDQATQAFEDMMQRKVMGKAILDLDPT